MEKVRTAIIGCGKVADAHAQAYQDMDNSEFAAVCGRNMEKTRRFAERYGVRAYTDISQMIRQEGIQAVSICTPHPIHAQNCVEAASNGCHVIVEKPFAVRVADGLAMLEAERKYGVYVAALFQRRFYEPCQRLKQAVAQGRIGKPILGDVTMLGWRDEAYYASDPWRGTWEGEGGGVLPTQACHQLDLLLWFMDSEIEEVFGVWRNFNHPYIEVEDTAAAIIKFRSGALATVTASNAQNPALYGRVRVHGDSGASVGVQTDGGAMFIAGMTPITEAPCNDIWTIPGEDGYKEQWRAEDEKRFFAHDPTVYYHRLQLQDFVDAVQQGRPPLVTGRDGQRSVELMAAIYRSTETGQPVKFPFADA